MTQSSLLPIYFSNTPIYLFIYYFSFGPFFAGTFVSYLLGTSSEPHALREILMHTRFNMWKPGPLTVSPCHFAADDWSSCESARK